MAINETNIKRLREIDTSLKDFKGLLLEHLSLVLPKADYDDFAEPVIEKAFAYKEQLEAERKTVEALAKTDMLASGDKSYDGNGYKIIVMPGRVSWDGKKLDGYMVAHPEITPFRKVGNPFVTIRDIEG